MSLLSTIQMASNSLQVQQIGLQVTGQNIANASTPGYSREQVLLEAAPTQQVGGLLLGTGVQIEGIQQEVDQFLNARVRGARAISPAQRRAPRRINSLRVCSAN